MKIQVTPVTTWTDVLNAARFTQRKAAVATEPSDKFKTSIVRAEHSPLRYLMFTVDLCDIPYYVAMHFRTHKLIHAPFVSTSRPDIVGTMRPRDEQRKTDPVNMRLFVDAQEIIAISRVRLCARAEAATRKVWQIVVSELAKTHPQLAAACVPSCVYRGFCPEMKPCGRTALSIDTARRRYLHAMDIMP